MKNVLIIGNGFDLYHGLPTKYTDVLKWISYWDLFNSIVDKSNDIDPDDELGLTDEWDIRLGEKNCITEDSIKDIAKNYKRYNAKQFGKLERIIKNNIWINHFNQIGCGGDRWIDFENEIAIVLKMIERVFDAIDTHKNKDDNPLFEIDDRTKKIVRPFIVGVDKQIWMYQGPVNRDFINKYVLSTAKSDTIKSTLKELNDMIEVLSFYLGDIVFHFKVKVISDQIKGLEINNLLSFNYTDTFKSVYGDKRILESIHRVHGSIVEKNIVLGVGDDVFDNLDFVYFQKYFQRIQKRTGSFYREWLKPFKRNTNLYDCNVYVMGHSLDPVDNTILNYFIESEWVQKITIYYYDQSAYESQVINLIKLMGTKEEVIRQIGDERIVFEQLQKAVVGDGRKHS